MERITGIGGVFFRAERPAELSRWYARHLGVKPPPETYDERAWGQEAGPTVFAPMSHDSEHFGRPGQQWSINFRVRDLDAMVAQLRVGGIQVEQHAETYPNGRFAELTDPEGTPIQLWEPAGADARSPEWAVEGDRLTRDELVSTSSERAVLEAFLDMYRDIVVSKVTGLPSAAAQRRLVPSATTLAGLVKHLTSVEREWFGSVLDQKPAEEAGVDVTDDGWVIRPGETVDALVADYRRACEESRAVAARFALEDSVPIPRMGRVTLRWLYVHMIEETARHAGHADILREQTDGSVGFDG